MNKIDFDELKLLADKPLDFERRRCELIKEHLDSLPPDRQARAHKFQQKLDDFRKKNSPAEFMRYCQDSLTENLAALQRLVEAISTNLPTSTEELRVIYHNGDIYDSI